MQGVSSIEFEQDEFFAVALDANSMPRGKFSLPPIENLINVIEATDLSAEVWIPEPVIWEWAEHIHSHIKETYPSYKILAGVLASVGFISLPSLTEISETSVEAILSRLETSLNKMGLVRILRLEDFPEAAAHGLRDQILQVGAGRLKGGAPGRSIKTGASDSASFRLLEAQIEADRCPTILVSEDSDVHRHNWAQTIFLAKRLWDVRKAIISYQTAAEELIPRIRELLRDFLISGSFDSSSTEIHGKSYAFATEYSSSDRWLNMTTDLAEIIKVDSIDGLEVDRSGAHITASVEAGIELSFTAALWNDQDEDLESYSTTSGMVAATLLISAYVEGDFAAISIDSIDVQGP